MCSDAKQWLTERKFAFTFREIFQQPLSRDELVALAAKASAGIHDLYAAKGALKVGLPEDGRMLTAAQILMVQVRNPTSSATRCSSSTTDCSSVFTRPRATR
jgi:arsenate reductase-like glutaredoxin family protein